MATPVSPVREQIFEYFPIGTHPRYTLEEAIFAHARGNVLDLGCGRTAPMLQKLRGKAETLYGIDLVSFETGEPELKLFNRDICNLDFLNNDSIDLAYSNAVMEHIEDCEKALREIRRVLKPGKPYIFLTPNFWDYSSLIAHFVPNSLHGWLVSRITERQEQDVFPTHYRCNTRGRIRRLASDAGFEIERFEYLGQYPAYLTFSRPLFWLGSQYERLLQSMPALGFLRGWIFCSLRKTAG